MGIIDGSGNSNNKVDLTKLTAEAHLALNFCIAVDKGPKSPEAIRFFIGKAKMHEPETVVDPETGRKTKVPGMTEKDFQSAYNRGILELLSYNLIEAKRDGHRDWQVTVIHYERMLKSASGIVVGEGS